MGPDPSLTELMFDLGLGQQIVGRTSYCCHPKPQIEQVQSVGGTKKINFSKLQHLKPDYVPLNIDENPKAFLSELENRNIKTIVTHPTRITDNLALYTLFGGIFAQDVRAAVLQEKFQAAFVHLCTARETLPRKRVLYIIWRDPWMTISSQTYIADVLQQINWQVVSVPENDRYPTFTFSIAELKQIDLVLFSSEPYPFGPSHISDFAKDFPDHGAKARLIDGELLSWYGSRAIPALDYLHDLINDIKT